MRQSIRPRPAFGVSGLVILAAAMAAAPVSAEHQAGLTLNEVIAQMQQAQASVHSLQLRFVEHLRRRALPEEIVRGELYYQRPHQLRIDQRAPDKQIILSDGTQVKVYTPAAQQIVTGDWKRWTAQSGFPAPLLDFMSDLTTEPWTARYTILFGGYDQPLYKLNFRPKRPGDTALELWISDESFLPVRGLVPGTDSSIDIDFSDVRMNLGLTAGIFQPEIPSDAVVVPIPS